MSTAGELMRKAPSTARSDLMRVLAAVAFAVGRYLVALANIARETGGGLRVPLESARRTRLPSSPQSAFGGGAQGTDDSRRYRRQDIRHALCR